MYEPSSRAATYMKQNLVELKEETDQFTIIVGDFNTPLSIIDRTTREKICKVWKNSVTASIDRI